MLQRIQRADSHSPWTLPPIVDALLPQSYDRALREHLVAAYERLAPIHLPPRNNDIWSARDEVCARVKAEGRGEAVLRAVHAT